MSHRMPASLPRFATQRGVAMLVALLIVAIATTVAAAIFVSQRYDIRLSTNIQDLEQAYQYAYGMEAWSGIWLSRDAQDNQYDSLKDAWAQEIPPLPIEENGVVLGTIAGKLEDMHGRFNLNNLLNDEGKHDASALEHFQSELTRLALPDNLAVSVADWIDADNQAAGNSAESDYYLSGDRPFHAANSFMLDTSELKLIRFDYDNDPQAKLTGLEKLLPWVTALPEATQVNVNTASESVLRAAGLDDEKIDLLAGLDESPIPSEGELFNILGVEEQSDDTPEEKLRKERLRAALGVTSHYFRLSGKITYGKSQLFVNSLLYREEKQGQVHVIMRQFEPITASQEEPSTTETLTETMTE